MLKALPVTIIFIVSLKLILPYIVYFGFPRYVDALPSFNIIIYSIYFKHFIAFCAYFLESPKINNFKPTISANITYAFIIALPLIFQIKLSLEVLMILFLIGVAIRSLIINSIVFSHILCLRDNIILLNVLFVLPLSLMVYLSLNQV